jgi:hypothetical protein
MASRLTFSVTKADVGGLVGHAECTPISYVRPASAWRPPSCMVAYQLSCDRLWRRYRLGAKAWIW